MAREKSPCDLVKMSKVESRETTLKAEKEEVVGGAKLVKCLSCKHKNLSLLLKTCVKMAGVVAQACSRELGGQRQENPWPWPARLAH